MKQSDLKYGNVIETNDGKRFLYICCLNEYKSQFVLLNHVSDFVSVYLNTKEPVAIIKVYEDYTCERIIWEKKTKPRLTEVERTLLINLDKRYKYLARDQKGNCLYAYKKRPEKSESGDKWSCDGSNIVFYSLEGFNHLFEFIKWEDEEPYSINELLK